MDKGEIPAEIKLGKGCENTAENKERKESDKNHGKKLYGKNVAQLFDTFKIIKDAKRNGKNTTPEKNANGPEYPILQETALFSL